MTVSFLNEITMMDDLPLECVTLILSYANPLEWSRFYRTSTVFHRAFNGQLLSLHQTSLPIKGNTFIEWSANYLLLLDSESYVDRIFKALKANRGALFDGTIMIREVKDDITIRYLMLDNDDFYELTDEWRDGVEIYLFYYILDGTINPLNMTPLEEFRYMAVRVENDPNVSEPYILSVDTIQGRGKLDSVNSKIEDVSFFRTQLLKLVHVGVKGLLRVYCQSNITLVC